MPINRERRLLLVVIIGLLGGFALIHYDFLAERVPSRRERIKAASYRTVEQLVKEGPVRGTQVYPRGPWEIR